MSLFDSCPKKAEGGGVANDTLCAAGSPTGLSPFDIVAPQLDRPQLNPGFNSLERHELVLIHEEAQFLFDLRLEIGLRQRELGIRHE